MRKHKILKSLSILLDYSKFIVKLLLQIAADKSQFAAIDFRTSHKLRYSNCLLFIILFGKSEIAAKPILPNGKVNCTSGFR